jgi:hypothetical protein
LKRRDAPEGSGKYPFWTRTEGAGRIVRRIGVRESWRGFGFDRGVFAVFGACVGYIDESYSSENPPRMFILTCTMAYGPEWSWIEMAWRRVLEEKNLELTRQGRTLVRRYHSNDLNNFRGDFSDWNPTERQDFCEKLLRVFSRHKMGYEGFAVNLQEIVEVWPDMRDDPLEAAYWLLLRFIMLGIGKGISEELPNEKITLFHDRCNYDGILLQAFNSLMNDPTFEYKNSFTTIAPMGWEDCIPLQPADLVAYENFKEAYRQLPGVEKPKQRRQIFSELIAFDSFVPHLKLMDRSNIAELKEIYDAAKARNARLDT